MKKNIAINKHRKALSVHFLLSCTLLLSALSVPSMNGPVNDKAGILRTSEENELTTFLNSVNNQTTVQILITIPC